MPQITLVSYQHDDDIRVRMIPQLLQPSGHVLVCLVLADVVDKQSSNSTSVVCGSDGSVTFLSSRVPDMSFDGFGVDLDGARCELDSDCRLGVQIELISGESTQQVGLPDTRVSNKHH